MGRPPLSSSELSKFLAVSGGGRGFQYGGNGSGRVAAGDDGVARGVLAGFREGFYRCLRLRRDALFSPCDAVLCQGGRVRDLARLSLVPEFGRGAPATGPRPCRAARTRAEGR